MKVFLNDLELQGVHSFEIIPFSIVIKTYVSNNYNPDGNELVINGIKMYTCNHRITRLTDWMKRVELEFKLEKIKFSANNEEIRIKTLD